MTLRDGDGMPVRAPGRRRSGVGGRRAGPSTPARRRSVSPTRSASRCPPRCRCWSALVRSNVEVPIGVHLHDTRGLAIANAIAALEHGAVRLDASVGGLGGCPFAPNATGNVPIEDLAHALGEMGVATGVSIPRSRRGRPGRLRRRRPRGVEPRRPRRPPVRHRPWWHLTQAMAVRRRRRPVP